MSSEGLLLLRSGYLTLFETRISSRMVVIVIIKHIMFI